MTQLNDYNPTHNLQVPELKRIFEIIQKEIETWEFGEYSLDQNAEELRNQKIRSLIALKCENEKTEIIERMISEFFGMGPLDLLVVDESLTEILILNKESIWIEKKGILEKSEDIFLSDISFRNIIEKICGFANANITIENPYFDGAFKNFRLAIVGQGITRKNPLLSLRRHPQNPWSFEKLLACEWCNPHQLNEIRKIFANKSNFLVVGSTSSGKTSVINGFLGLCDFNERVVVIEDSPELTLPNNVSSRLLTREDPQGVLPSIDQNQLVKITLRLRPDRIVMGEIRGTEAKDFLMAISTGHQGCFGSLHAEDPHQALLRLEMLIQLGAPQWNLSAIRKLILWSLQYIIVVKKVPKGRILSGIYRISSLEESGFSIDKM